MADMVAGECMKHGIYVMSWINCLIAAPPLIISKEEMDKGVLALDKALELADKQIA